MAPDATGDDVDMSDDVCTVTEIEPGVAAPMVMPLMVTVNASVAPMVAPDVAKTKAVLRMAVHVMLRPMTLLAPKDTKGVAEGAKKLGGYASVIGLPGKICMGVANVSVTRTFVFPDTRSDGTINNGSAEMKRVETGILNQIEYSFELVQFPPRSRQLAFRYECDAYALLQEMKIRAPMSLFMPETTHG